MEIKDMSYLFQCYAKVYDKFMNLFSLDDDSAILNLIESYPQKIADVGGGTGVTAEKLVKLGHKVTIIDPCMQMTELAKKKDEAIQIINKAMPCELGAKFDIILIRDCLHHVKRQTELLDCCINMLEEHGMIIITDFSPQCWKTKLIFLFERCCFERIKPVSKSRIFEYLDQAGLQAKQNLINERDFIVWGRKA